MKKCDVPKCKNSADYTVFPAIPYFVEGHIMGVDSHNLCGKHVKAAQKVRSKICDVKTCKPVGKFGFGPK